MGIGNFQRGTQIDDGRKQLQRVRWVLLHDHPFFVRKRAGLEQNRVGNAHFSDVVEQGAAPNLHQFGVGQSHVFRQTQRFGGDALAVPFGFFVAQIERARPTFERGIIGQHQLVVGTLHFAEQTRVINGDGCLSRQRFQKFQLLFIQAQQGTMPHFQHALDLPAATKGTA